jgi:hypothetical protein
LFIYIFIYKKITEMSVYTSRGPHGSVVVKAVCYTAEALGGSRPDEVNFLSIYLILPAALDPGFYSASDRNEYQKQKKNVSWE